MEHVLRFKERKWQFDCSTDKICKIDFSATREYLFAINTFVV